MGRTDPTWVWESWDMGKAQGGAPTGGNTLRKAPTLHLGTYVYREQVWKSSCLVSAYNLILCNS